MADPALSTLWQILGGILTLNPAAFVALETLPAFTVDALALGIVLLAGLSQEVAQAIILFVNRVQPLRFVVSLLLGSVLFAFGYLFWGLSVWVAGLVFLTQPIPLRTVADVLAFSYLPLVFSFFGAMPYFGVPILRLLAVWNLLAMVVGFAALAALPARLAFAHVMLGWVVLVVVQQTVGQPVANLGRWLVNQVAGVKIVRSPAAVHDLIYGAFLEAETASPPAEKELPDQAEPGGLPSQPLAETGPPWAAAPTAEVVAQRPWHIQQALQLIGLTLLGLLVAIALGPLRELITGWYDRSEPLVALAFDLLWISLVALAIGGLLAPVEALGWWAGWYGDDIQTVELEAAQAALEAPETQRSPQQRYVVYLDGVGQTDPDYQPAVAHYLESLEAILPDDICLIKGLMSYSVLNLALTEDRPLAFFWRLVDRFKDWRWAGLLPALLINLRNVLVVTVSADLRYGPIFNRGIAQQIYTNLLESGYPPWGGVPITLIGYSGGGQIALGALPFLKRVLRAPIEVISLGGVISGSVQALEAEQLYHLVGTKDSVERLGPLFFPRRWPISRLSYWNRARKRGRISFISLGPVGHQNPGGIMDAEATLPDGRTHLQQTLDLTLEILEGDLRKLLEARRLNLEVPGAYYRYQAAAFNQLDNYPLQLQVDPEYYRPIGAWVGRLILPAREKRRQVNGVLFEIHQAPPEYAEHIGRIVPLRWQPSLTLANRLRQVVRDIHFSADTEYSYRQGLVHPIRLNHWRLVDPLESLAGARPIDDIVVRLSGPVQVRADRRDRLALSISADPVQVSGRVYALVQFIGPAADVGHSAELYRVVHYRRTSRRFDGPQEVVRLPAVVPGPNNISAAVNTGLEQSPPNPAGWYIYGAKDSSGLFVVQALLPRQLLQLEPDRLIVEAKAGADFIRRESWQHLAAQKGTIRSVLISPGAETLAAALSQWQLGDRALLVHVYGGIGGKKTEPAARGPVYFGHFAYGVATVVHEPLADEPMFDIVYHQVYTHNSQGIVAGSLHWSRYMGDRQWGFLGTRPVSDILIKLPAYTEPFNFGRSQRCALDGLIDQLELMVARYRTGDGTGGTYVGPANNCAQDSNQALYASVKQLEDAISRNPTYFQQWQTDHPEQKQRFDQLLALRRAIQWELLPFGSARADWEHGSLTLGSNLEDYPLKTLGRGLISWRTMLPRKASDTVTKVFLAHKASLWVLRTNQVGGYDTDIEPIAPVTL
jgi:predicted Abi (CAAX) family protease